MKKLLFLLLSISVFSCQEHKNTENSVKPEKPKQETVKLWQANTATTAGINQMKKLINDFDFNQDNDACVALKNELVDSFNGILTGCTMEGEAHQHLHDYLVPMKGLLDEITHENSLIKNKELLRNYQKHLEKYNTIFK